MRKRSTNHTTDRANGRLRRARLSAMATVSMGGDAGRAPVLITGGAGFIGANVADHCLSAGQPVLLYDNLSRPGVERNLAWLRAKHGDLVRIEVADIEDYASLRKAVRGISKVFHFAAQVTVTTSLESPFHDFDVNARGTLNLLEALRERREPPPLLFTSTNKVYGDLGDVPLRARETRYEPADEQTRSRGFNESRPLDFHSPYGCSKGAAEQYVLDYARTFRLPAVVFRMSCIYGPHQFGTEDQGWVAHFVIRALRGNPITVYGDGKQVRDILFIDDLVEAFALAHQHIAACSGKAFNIGGSSRHTLSLLELVELIAEFQARRPLVRFDDWRPADQQYDVSDVQKFTSITGWNPKVSVREGTKRLFDWLRAAPESRPVPVVVPKAPIGGDGERDGAKTPSKLRVDRVVLPGREPRSKRIWKLNASESELLEGKIIKFP